MVVAAFVTGIILGMSIAVIIFCTKSIGALRVDHSDPDDGPYLFLELKKGPEAIKQKRFVILTVKIQDFLSQK